MNSNQLHVSKSALTGGHIRIPGSKNSALAILIATCLTDDPIELLDIPNIEDTDVTLDILKEIGVGITIKEDSIVFQPAKIHTSHISNEMSGKIRASYYFVGAMLARFGEVSIGYPGGDKIGNRPMDMHINGFKALGADVHLMEDHYVVSAPDGLYGGSFYFNRKSCGATINMILTAVLAKGRTTLYNSALDPEVVDLVQLLSKMGAKIRGAGTNVITIDGVESLRGATHRIIPDRLIAGTYMILAGLGSKPITLTNIIPKHLEAVTQKLEEVGVGIKIIDDQITAYPAKEIHSTVVFADMYPAFPTDLQQPITVLLTQADGQSVVIDQVWKERFALCHELNKMSADITVNNHGLAIINGPTVLKGTDVFANDIRAGMSLMIAGLIAEDTTTINNVHQIYRGYENVIEQVTSIGGTILEAKM